MTAALLALGLAGCADASGSDDPASPTSSTTASSSDDETTGPTGEGTGTGDDPCAGIDVAELGKVIDARLGEPQPYDEGPDLADGCSVATASGDVTIAVDLRTEHGSLAQDARLAQLSGEETPEEVTVAGQDGLFLSGTAGTAEYTGLVTHVGDLLLLINVQDVGAEEVSADQLRELTLATAEMVAPRA